MWPLQLLPVTLHSIIHHIFIECLLCAELVSRTNSGGKSIKKTIKSCLLMYIISFNPYKQHCDSEVITPILLIRKRRLALVTQLIDNKSEIQIEAVWPRFLGLAPYTLWPFSVQIFPSSTLVQLTYLFPRGLFLTGCQRCSRSLQSAWSQGADILGATGQRSYTNTSATFISLREKLRKERKQWKGERTGPCWMGSQAREESAQCPGKSMPSNTHAPGVKYLLGHLLIIWSDQVYRNSLDLISSFLKRA